MYQFLIVAETLDLVQFSARQASPVAGAVGAPHLAVPNAETGVGMMDRAVWLYLNDAAFFNIHDPHDIIAFAEGFEDRNYLRGGILF